MAAKKIGNMQNAKLLMHIGQRGQWKGGCWSLNAYSRLLSGDKSGEKISPILETAKTAAEQAKKIFENIEALTKEIAKLKGENEKLLEKYRRSLADSENLRTRLNKQISDAKIFGIQDFCKDFLEVADILGRATQAVPQDQLTDRNPHLKNLYKGLTMTRASLMQVFKRHGLEPMDPINEKFNPNFHEALFQKVDRNIAPDTIVEVTKLGYKLHERLIRPALVGVSKPL